MRAIDTNVLVRLLARDDPKQVQAAEAFVADGGWVSHLVLVESVWVLTSVYDLGRAEIGTAVTMLLKHRSLLIERSATVAAALEQYLAHPKVAFSDCLVLETARAAKRLPLGTFDRALSRLEGAIKV
jgi:predicted nucleic-acid-binding protein